jgi:hypothetical protein
MSHEYRPFANPFGIILGVIILWAGSLGLFFLGQKIIESIVGGEGSP